MRHAVIPEQACRFADTADAMDPPTRWIDDNARIGLLAIIQRSASNPASRYPEAKK
jgi:hypothetical protein